MKNKCLSSLTLLLAVAATAGAQTYNDTVDAMNDPMPTYFQNMPLNQLPDTHTFWLFGGDTTTFFRSTMMPDASSGWLFFQVSPWGNRLCWAHGINTFYRWFHYHYTEYPLQVVGLAVSAYGFNMITETPTDSLPYQESLLLYDALPDSFMFKASLDYDPRDSHRFMKLHLDTVIRRNTGSIPFFQCSNALREDSTVIRLYEYYFDDPIWVEDSFYVGMTNHNCEDIENLPDYVGFYTSAEIACVPYIIGARWLTKECAMQIQRYRMDLRDDNGWDTTVFRATGQTYPILFPIIVPDTAEDCRPVEDLRVVDIDSGFAQIAWNTFTNHEAWEVRYGAEGTPADSCPVVTCRAPTVVLTGLADDVHYWVSVRALCSHHDSLYYSDWSDSVELFHEGSHVEPEGIEGNGLLAHFTTLMPNPASGTVQVMSSFRMHRIEAYDHSGRKVMDSEAQGVTAAFSVEQWAKGVYVILIHTEQGIASKRMMVQ